MNKYTLSIAVCVILSSRCSLRLDDNMVVINNHINKYSNKVTVNANIINEYNLDEESINLIDYLEYIDTDTISNLSFLTKYNNSIYFYNASNKNFIRKIKVDLKTIGKIQGYHYISDDSIFVYSYSKGCVYGIDVHSNIFNRYKISSYPKVSDAQIFPYTYLQTSAPLKVLNKNILSVGFVTGETDLETHTNRPVCSVFSMDNYSQLY